MYDDIYLSAINVIVCVWEGGSLILLIYPVSCLLQIVNKLNIATDPVKAKQNEELLAKISKTSLTYLTIDVLTTMIEHSKKRIVQLLQKYTKLKDLYADLDGILSEFSIASFLPVC